MVRVGLMWREEKRLIFRHFMNGTDDQHVALVKAEKLFHQAQSFVSVHGSPEILQHACRVSDQVHLAFRPVAMLHDLIDIDIDTDTRQAIVKHFPDWVVLGLNGLAPRPAEPTLDYILRIKGNPMLTQVVVADWEDQVSEGRHRNIFLGSDTLDQLAVKLYALRC